MTRTALFLFVSACTGLLASAAQAQPVVAAFSGSASASVLASDTGPVVSQDIDQPVSSLVASDAGQLSDPIGSGSSVLFQIASGDAASDTSVAGPLAPSIQASASASGSQGGIIPASTTVAIGGDGAQIWEFAF